VYSAGQTAEAIDDADFILQTEGRRNTYRIHTKQVLPEPPESPQQW
jgi:hypothetical protein